MTITPYSIFDQTPHENLQTVERGLYALTDLLEGKAVDELDINTRQNLAEITKTLADLTQNARLEMQQTKSL